MQLETERLILRHWNIDDAESLYEYAKDPRIGPSAGWEPHKSLEESRECITTILSSKGCFAVILKTIGKPVGCIEIHFNNELYEENEGEIGYWIGVPFWGQGLIPEATNEMLRYGFEELHLNKIWCKYHDGNIKSKRVQEKSGFVYHHSIDNDYNSRLNEYKKCHVSVMTKEMWENMSK